MSLTLEAQPRTAVGNQVKALRRQGLVPVAVYGKRQDATNLQVDARSLERVLHTGGASQLVEVMVKGGGKHNVLIREVQRDPVSHRILHADLYAVSMTEKQRVSIPLHQTGKPVGLASGLMVLENFDHIEIEALPADLPAHIDVDISQMDLHRPITVADLPALPGVSYLMDTDEVLFHLVTMRGAEAEEEAPVEAEMVEPEVVGKGKAEEEEEEE